MRIIRNQHFPQTVCLRQQAYRFCTFRIKNSHAPRTRSALSARRQEYDFSVFICFAGKGRLYAAYSLSGSEGEDSPRRYGGGGSGGGSQHTYQHPLYQQTAGLSDTPTSENASDATLTDSELALARDSTLLVHNGK